jgi:hypothetical protein
LAQPLFDAELLQFRCGDFPIIGTDRNDDLRFASRLRSCRKIPIHHKAVQSRDAAPAHRRARSELESAPPRAQVEWRMAFLLSINGTNRSVDVDGNTSLPCVPGTKFGCGSQTGSSDTITINQVGRP